ncbi:hypothetical protein K440DRAFT_607139 [Wilcoxina mikolae CBS 423.85]|nr:hypothetical protein K440DRAFT_607139 [Wilcoxina mikolae CBS 423.85]
MGKKRRSTSSRTGAPSSAPSINPKEAKLAAINTWADVADEEDAFHLQRDAVALSANDRGPRDESDEDEEVMGLGQYGYEQSDDDEDEFSEEEEEVVVTGGNAQDSSDEEEAEEEEVEEGWGSSKKAYYGDAEEEVDAAEEEAEARRIQQKHMSTMSAADFAFDDEDWAAPTSTATETKKTAVVTEQLPTKLPDAPEERIKLLNSRHPEFQPLTEEFLALQQVFPALEMGAMAAETVGETESAVVKKWKVASAYLGVLSMYFAILTEAGKADDGGIDGVREHPVMSALLGVRSAWEKVKGERVERIEARLEPVIEETEAEKGRKRKLAEQTGRDSESSEDEETVQVIKKARAAKEDFSDLDALIAFAPSASKPKRLAKAANNDADFGEDAVLNDIDAEEKTQRKKNLRFYTSQINAKTTKRDAASRGAGGDADIPHRERRRERELRLQAEAQRRRDKGEGADLSDGEPEPESERRQSKPSTPDDDPDNEYYSLLSATSKSRKKEKKKLYEAEKAAAKEGNMLQVTEGALGPDGKREIGWKIMKNKGLTPHRKKEVRNPRVKKKMQYANKMKKLGSQKAVYKGGLQGAYGGEATGIKKNLVKSVKFAS